MNQGIDFQKTITKYMMVHPRTSEVLGKGIHF